MIPRRFAGYRLAGLPLENVSGKVKEAADVLNSNYTQLPTYEESIDIPGTQARVVMNAWPNGRMNLKTNSDVVGNSGEVQKIIDAQPPGVLTLGWGLEGDGSLNDKQKFRAARIAQKEFKRIFADIPNGTIVQNAPIGGMNGDYTRADAYMSQGMGPLQHDGQQYAIMNNGVMNPVSPFTPLEGHAEHLSRRSSAGGQTDIANLIQDELASRRDRQAYGYEDSSPSRYVPGPEYDGDEDGVTRVGPTEFKDFAVREMTEDAYRSEFLGGGRGALGGPRPANHEDRVVRDERRTPYLPEIAQRHVAKNAIQGISQSEYLQLRDRDSFDNSPAFNVTPQEIGEFRDEQTRFASQPSYLREMSDAVERVYNRPSPPVLSIDDAGRVLQDRRRPRTRDMANTDLNLTEDDRRTIMRNRVGGMFTGGVDSDPTDLRTARSGFSDQRNYSGRWPSNPRQPNSPALVEDMRSYQAIAARVDPYLRGPRSESEANRASTNPDIAMAVQLDPNRTLSSNITGHSDSSDPNTRIAGPRVPPVESREFPAPTPVPSRSERRQSISAVNAIRDELGLRRRLSNGSLAPETDDVPF